MTIKVPPSLGDRLKSQDTTVLRGVLEYVDGKLIEQLKKSTEDVRYVQGYSAAIDMLIDLATRKN